MIKWKTKIIDELSAMSDKDLFDEFAYECLDRLSERLQWRYNYSVELFCERMKRNQWK